MFVKNLLLVTFSDGNAITSQTQCPETSFTHRCSTSLTIRKAEALWYSVPRILLSAVRFGGQMMFLTFLWLLVILQTGILSLLSHLFQNLNESLPVLSVSLLLTTLSEFPWLSSLVSLWSHSVKGSKLETGLHPEAWPMLTRAKIISFILPTMPLLTLQSGFCRQSCFQEDSFSCMILDTYFYLVTDNRS